MDFFEFKLKFQELSRGVFQDANQFPWNQSGVYCAWLANTHYYVTHSTRILALTSGALALESPLLAQRFISHTLEERGHELLLIKDLNAMSSNLKDNTIVPEMKFYLWSLYHWLSPGGSPLGVLGWVLSLEGLAAHMGPRAYEAASNSWGSDCCTFLKVHSQADQDHLEKALNVASQLSPHHLTTVADAMMAYAYQYQLFLNKITCNFSQKRAAA